MKSHLLAVALMASTGLQATTQAPTSTVRGVVTRVGSSEPLPGAEITLTSAPAPGGVPVMNATIRLVIQPTGPQDLRDAVANAIAGVVSGGGLVPGTPATPGRTFNAVADSAGRFEIPGVSVGNYTVSARLDGFVGPAAENGVSPSGASMAINVVAGQEPPEVALSLVRGITIEGHVTRPDGRPASGVTVTPYLLTYRDGRPSIVAGGTSRTTDDRGQYRLFWLGPGEYIIGATAVRTAGSAGVQGDPSSSTRTFFPGTLDPSEAVTLAARDDPGLTGIDFNLLSGASFSIRGRAINPLPLAAPRRLPNGDADVSIPAFTLVPRDGAIDESTPRQVQNAIATDAGRRNGDFEIRGVRPGLYDLFPVVNVLLDGQPRFASGRVPVEVRDMDVEGVVIAVNPGVDLRGSFKVNGDAASVKLETLRVALRPLDNIPAPIAARIGGAPIDVSGAFVLRHVPEALYTLAVNPLPSNAYVADIRQNGTSVFDSGIVAGKETPASVEVVLGTNGQILEGTVLDEKRAPVANAAVVLVPPQARRQNPILYRNAKSDADGRFKLVGVAPGDYKVFSWRNVPATAWMNATFLARYESQSRNVTVRAGNNANLSLQIISAPSSR